MDILIQTKKAIYSVSWRKGIKKVETIDWTQLKSTFDMLLESQTREARDANSSPVIVAINEEVAKGRESARANDASWRAKKRPTMVQAETNEFWEADDKSEFDRAHRALHNAKLER